MTDFSCSDFQLVSVAVAGEEGGVGGGGGYSGIQCIQYGVNAEKRGWLGVG